MPKPQGWRVDSMDTEYDATLGGVFLFSTPNPMPMLNRRRRVLVDHFGGTLAISPLQGKSRRVVNFHKRHRDPKFEDHADFVFHYEIAAKWSGNTDGLLWPYVERIRDFVACVLLIDGPYVLDDHGLYYVETDSHTGFRTQGYRPSPTSPLAYPRYNLGILTVPRKYDSIVSLCRQLQAALPEQLFLYPGSRWESKERRHYQGTRLELAVRLMGQASNYAHLYDVPLRLSIALEALFQSSQIDKRALPMVCARMLKDRTPPDQVLDWVLALSEWRNRFVHGQEPPFYYPPASKHTKDLVSAAAAGCRLLSALIKAIVGDPTLLAIFNTAGDEKTFAKGLFRYCTA